MYGVIVTPKRHTVNSGPDAARRSVMTHTTKKDLTMQLRPLSKATLKGSGNLT